MKLSNYDFTDRAKHALDVAQKVAASATDCVGGLDILVGLMSHTNTVARTVLRDAGINELKMPFREPAGPYCLETILTAARDYAASLGHRYIGTEHLLYGLYTDKAASDILHASACNRSFVRDRINYYLGVKVAPPPDGFLRLHDKENRLVIIALNSIHCIHQNEQGSSSIWLGYKEYVRVNETPEQIDSLIKELS